MGSTFLQKEKNYCCNFLQSDSWTWACVCCPHIDHYRLRLHCPQGDSTAVISLQNKHCHLVTGIEKSTGSKATVCSKGEHLYFLNFLNFAHNSNFDTFEMTHRYKSGPVYFVKKGYVSAKVCSKVWIISEVWPGQSRWSCRLLICQFPRRPTVLGGKGSPSHKDCQSQRGYLLCSKFLDMTEWGAVKKLQSKVFLFCL